MLAARSALAVFLAAFAWFFGTEDAEPGDGLGVIVRGGLPIAAPTLVHPIATAAVFRTVAGALLPHLPEWLGTAAMAWLAWAVVWAGRAAMKRQARLLAMPGLLAVMFVVLPPLTAFAICFVSALRAARASSSCTEWTGACRPSNLRRGPERTRT